ncbi:MAG: hypothetical protein AVDCRST_MAG50-874, partial [uncultured Acidimicrobiales bacterium]
WPRCGSSRQPGRPPARTGPRSTATRSAKCWPWPGAGSGRRSPRCSTAARCGSTASRPEARTGSSLRTRWPCCPRCPGAA